MKILHSPTTLLHDSHEFLSGSLIPALESPHRITSILRGLRQASRTVDEPPHDPSAALSAASRIHTESYLSHLRTIHAEWLDAGLLPSPASSVLPETFPPCSRAIATAPRGPPSEISARAGYYVFDMSAGIMSHTYAAALASVDLARLGAIALSERPDTPVLALCRPPGHHCASDIAGGYCYINNTAVAVSELVLRHPDEQVVILDIDFHHGNGAQKIFYDVQNPGYVSVHGEGDYPYYSGAREEVGEGEGEGWNWNVPLPCDKSVDLERYLEALEEAVEKVEEWGARWVVVSLGFDTFVDDPLGKFALRREDYRVIGERVGRLNRPLLVVLEGGYAVEDLGGCMCAFLDGLEDGLWATRKGQGSEEEEEEEEEVEDEESCVLVERPGEDIKEDGL